MATANSVLVRALRETARRLQTQTTPYKWARFGQCNCGHLAQTLTGLSGAVLQQAAEKQRGDWSEQALGHERVGKFGAPPRERGPIVDYGDRLALDEGA